MTILRPGIPVSVPQYSPAARRRARPGPEAPDRM